MLRPNIMFSATIMATQRQIVDVPSANERHRVIAESLDQAGDATHFVPSQDGYLELPVITVDSTCLVYRVDNGRLLSELADAARSRGTSVETLKKHADSGSVQQLLHDLLVAKARDPAGPIYEELARHGRQTEPLLIGRDGVVLNGNRRLAAMRELAAQEPDRYATFTGIRAAVLPRDIDLERLEYIEAALQMAPELKLGYSWINRRLKLRQHVRDLPRQRVVAAYRFADAEEIDIELAELALAEEYLDWLGEAGRYQRVAELQARFAELRRQLTGIGAEHVAALWKLIGFAMIRAEDQVEANVGHYFPFADPVPPAQRHWVLRSLAEDHGLVSRQPAGRNQPVDEPLAGRLGPLLDDPDRAETNARAVIALVDTLKGDPQRLLGAHRLLHHLRSAHNVLEGLDIGDINNSDLRHVRAEFAALEQYIQAFEHDDPRAHPAPLAVERGARLLVRKFRRALRRFLGKSRLS